MSSSDAMGSSDRQVETNSRKDFGFQLAFFSAVSQPDFHSVNWNVEEYFKPLVERLNCLAGKLKKHIALGQKNPSVICWIKYPNKRLFWHIFDLSFHHSCG